MSRATSPGVISMAEGRRLGFNRLRFNNLSSDYLPFPALTTCGLILHLLMAKMTIPGLTEKPKIYSLRRLSKQILLQP